MRGSAREACSLTKREFLYETISSKLLRSHSVKVLWVASCDCTTWSLYQKLTKNLIIFAGANRIFSLKKFRNSPSQMFHKLGVLKNFAEFSGKHLYWSHFLMHLQAWDQQPHDKMTPAMMFSGEFIEILRTHFLQNISWLETFKENNLIRALL